MRAINQQLKGDEFEGKNPTIEDTTRCEGCDDRLCDTSCPIGLAKRTKEKCRWLRQFDGHFAISCPSGERGNGQFKGKDKGARWEFEYCPYCGREIEEYFDEDSPHDSTLQGEEK